MSNPPPWYVCPWCEAMFNTLAEAISHDPNCDVGPDLDMGLGPEE